MKEQLNEEAVVSMALYRDFSMETLKDCLMLYFISKEKYPNKIVIQKNFIMNSSLDIGSNIVNRFGFINLENGESLLDDYFEFIRVDMAKFTSEEKQDRFTEFLKLLDDMSKDKEYENYIDNLLLLKALEKFEKSLKKSKKKGGK